MDYRRVNALTTQDTFPLPRNQDCLDSVSGAHLISTFDLTSGYNQVPVKKSNNARLLLSPNMAILSTQHCPSDSRMRLPHSNVLWKSHLKDFSDSPVLFTWMT